MQEFNNANYHQDASACVVRPPNKFGDEPIGGNQAFIQEVVPYKVLTLNSDP